MPVPQVGHLPLAHRRPLAISTSSPSNCRFPAFHAVTLIRRHGSSSCANGGHPVTGWTTNVSVRVVRGGWPPPIACNSKHPWPEAGLQLPVSEDHGALGGNGGQEPPDVLGGQGRAEEDPWAVVQPRWSSTRLWQDVSTPSATHSSPSRSAMEMMAETSESSSPSGPRTWTNDWLIFNVLTGNDDAVSEESGPEVVDGEADAEPA